jgi:CheY-specific phosphatase CheX
MKASDFVRLVPDCCSEVLDAMYFTTVLESSTRETLPEDFPLEAEDFAFTLHFAGDISGDFGLHLGPATARSLASNFLGEDESGLSSPDVGDVVGELANMLCGSVMSHVGGECKFVLSHPQSVPALPDAGAGKMLVSALETDGGNITAWVIVEGNA